MYGALSAVAIWLLWFGGAALIMLLDARRQRRIAVEQLGADIGERRIWPYMLLAVICGALPLFVYFGATRKGKRGLLIGAGVMLAHLSVVLLASAVLKCGPTLLDARPSALDPDAPSRAPILPGAGPGRDRTAMPPAAPTRDLPPPAAGSLPKPPADLNDVDLGIDLKQADMLALIEPLAAPMGAALGHLATRCAAAEGDQGEPLPASVTSGLRDMPNVAELVAECVLPKGGSFSYRPLRQGIKDLQTAMVYTLTTAGGTSMSLSCPSSFSDDPRAVDLGMENATSEATSRLTVTVLGERDCPSAKRVEQERKKKEWLRAVVEPFGDWLDEIASRAACPPSSGAFDGGPSPARGTPLAADSRVLDVKVTCWWMKGTSGTGMAYERLHVRPDDAPSDISSSSSMARVAPSKAYKISFPSLRFRDALEIAYERPLGPRHKVTVELFVRVP